MASQGSLNKVMLIGNVGTKVDARYFEGGGAVGNLTLATNETYYSKKQQQKVTTTEWHNLVVNNKLVEVFEKYVEVGDKLYIEGRLRTRKWQDQSGNDRYTTEIVVRQFTFLTPKVDGENTSSTSQQQQPSKESQQSSGNQASEPNLGEEGEDDDLPF